jgi:hypothetical protein
MALLGVFSSSFFRIPNTKIEAYERHKSIKPTSRRRVTPGFALDASFAAAPGGVGPFRIRTDTDDVVGNVGAGIDLIGPRGAELKLFYEGRFGDLVSEQSGGIKASLPF